MEMEGEGGWPGGIVRAFGMGTPCVVELRRCVCVCVCVFVCVCVCVCVVCNTAAAFDCLLNILAMCTN